VIVDVGAYVNEPFAMPLESTSPRSMEILLDPEFTTTRSAGCGVENLALSFRKIPEAIATGLVSFLPRAIGEELVSTKLPLSSFCRMVMILLLRLTNARSGCVCHVDVFVA